MRFYSSLCFTMIGLGALVSAPIPSAIALKSTEISAIASAITVRIEGQNPGSGVLIQRDGDTYQVLTAAHVVASEDEYEIITPDEAQYPLDYKRVRHLPGIDLALLEFTSSRSYEVANLGDSAGLESGSSVFVSGFPMPTAAITDTIWTFSPGSITANARRPLADGYALVYTNKTLPGMSGGAVLNNQGQLIGIHGRADTEQTIQRSETIYVKTGFNLGIPIQSFIDLVPEIASNLNTVAKAPVPVSPKPTADDWFLQAGKRYQQQDYQGAIADYTRAIQLKPSFAEAYYSRGVSKDSLKAYADANTDYTQAIQFKPDYPTAFYNRGINHFDLGNPKKAIADLSQAIQLNPDYAYAYYNRGVVHSAIGQPQAALEDYSRAIGIKNDYAGAYYNRAVVRGKLKDLRGAIADYNRVIALEPSHAQAYNNRGNIRAALQDTQGAIADLNQAIRLQPNKANAYYNRGNIRYSQGDAQGAIADLSQAIQLRPDYANAYYNRGIVRKTAGDRQGAIADFKASARISQEQGNQAAYQEAISQLRRLSP